MGTKRLERFLTSCFCRYGRMVGKWPLIFFLAPLLLTFLLAPAIFLVQYDDNIILLFTPFNAPSRNELRVFNEFSLVQPLESAENNGSVQNSTEKSHKRSHYLQVGKIKPRANPWIFVNVIYENRTNVMTVETWSTISQFVSDIYQNFTCQVHETSEYPGHRPVKMKTLRYVPDFCNVHGSTFECPPLDKQVRTFQNILNFSYTQGGKASKVQLTYPVMYLWNSPINWGHFIYGAEVNESSKLLISAKEVVLKLEFQFDLMENREFEARQCMSQLADYVYSYVSDENPALKFYFDSEWYQNGEVIQAKNRFVALIPYTIVLVTVFAVISSYYARAPILGILEAILGVLAIGLSLVTSFAILFACGIPYNFVMTIMPFLTLCVGIDNDFLLMTAWRRSDIENAPPRERLARAFMDCGPSLVITSVNDILCFAVGCLSESPAISDFCLFTAVGLAFRFFYQLTFFSGALVYMNEQKWATYGDMLWKLEQNIQARFFTSKKTEIVKIALSDDVKKNSTTALCINYVGPNEHRSPERVVQNFFRKWYSQFLGRRWVRFVISLTFLGYLVLVGYGSAKFRINISLQKIVTDDSRLQTFLQTGEKYSLTTQIGNVIVTKAPDFRKETELNRFLEFVRILEHTPDYSPDPKDTTVLWLRNYIEFRSYVGDPEADFYDVLDEFLLSSAENQRFISDLRFKYTEDGRLAIDSFRFTAFYQNLRTWDDSVKLMLFWREVCANYSEYGAIVQDYFFRNTYLDQRLTLASSTLQTMGIASLMIAFVTVLLMPDAASMFFTCFSSLSVDLGVIAALNAWGADLDPVTMACLLMTIGFSVYYTARMCYCYRKAGMELNMSQKLSYTLGSIGWPILQGGLGTWIGSVPLLFVQAYMGRTFSRTIILVVLIGLLHGLLFMPVMMSLYDQKIPAFRKFRLHSKKTKRCCCG